MKPNRENVNPVKSEWSELLHEPDSFVQFQIRAILNVKV